MSSTRRTARLAVLPGAVAAALLLPAAPAAAHVGITPDTTAADAYAVVEVAVPHGCDGSPTTSVAISVPDGVIGVVPTRHPLWDLATAEADDGTQTVTYTALEPLPEGVRDTFEIALRLPDAPGETLVFPTIQTCEEGETAWIEVAPEGEDAHELEHPAPSFTLTEATGEDHHGAGSAAEEEPAQAGVGPVSTAALGLGAVGAVLGGLALARRGRPRRP
ncbi:YcnI family protein [Nocardioides bruguierae]|uniref:YcnI family protein n=1 Tax=Nocardioides bruguierae TaxID=2945102 RepID=UPI002020FEBF|nr:YcnI family protein [Nocardioides bruguierae]MCL8024493.1 YcnI family protein [Nocardioides bruguierae]